MINLTKAFSNKQGNSTPLIIAVVLSIIILSCAAFEFMRLMVVAVGVRDAVQSAIIDVATENWDEVYNGLREGYSGGYSLSGTTWEQDLTTGDIYDRLADNLGLEQKGGSYVKYTGDVLEYEVSCLSINVINAPLAPSNPRSINQFTVEGAVDVMVPLSFGWEHLPPMKIRMGLKAIYTPKF
ncbi:hypothetical protein [Dehalobacter sp. 14DCB1]|uniref:hypothetical protein n=1 Tax=Dehalobacter sp. 14DCB1 TaxID=2070227 RepID=UPI0010452DCB|nr:hypothetical protein [Dehalobacter sp. 14DCB1]TCX53613.1 hypothetical protein C1I36_02410 [Dehalobacter sp. 14DCB1]